MALTGPYDLLNNYDNTSLNSPYNGYFFDNYDPSGTSGIPTNDYNPVIGEPGNPYQLNVVGTGGLPTTFNNGSQEPVSNIDTGGTNSPIDFSNTDFSSFGNFGNILKDIFSGAGDMSKYAMALPLIGMAIQQWRNANKYGDISNDVLNIANPFGGERDKYQKMLSDIYTDPTAVLNNPSHVATVTKQMNAIEARNRASGYMGSGKNSLDLADYQANADAQYLDAEKARLAQLAGAQFGPEAAAALWMKGQENQMNSESNALGALGYLFQNLFGQGDKNSINIQNSGGNTGGGGNTTGGGGYNPANPGNVFNAPVGTRLNPSAGGLLGANGKFPVGATLGGTDAYGNRIVNDANGSQIGIVGKDGSYYPHNPDSDFGTPPPGSETGIGYDPSQGPPNLEPTDPEYTQWQQQAGNPDYWSGWNSGTSPLDNIPVDDWFNLNYGD